MYCEACGREIESGTKICPYCLAKQSIYDDASVQTEETSGEQEQPKENTDTQAVGVPFTAEEPKTEQAPFTNPAEDTVFHPEAGTAGNGGNGGSVPPQDPYLAYQNGNPNGWQPKPEDTRPLGSWAFFGYSLLFSLPFFGFILQIVFACIDGNVNRKHFARSRLLLTAFWFVISTVLLILIFYFAYRYGDSFSSYSDGGDGFSPFMDEYMQGFQHNF